MKTDKIKQLLLVSASGIFLFAGCAQNDYPMSDDTGGEVTISATLEGMATRTSADGSAFETHDAIGVFMLSNGGSIPTGILTVGGQTADNRKFIHNGTRFVPDIAGQAIYYPLSGAVDFIAYYPYRATPTQDPYIYKVNVSNQTNPAAIDLLYGSAQNQSKSANAVPIHFTHQLSKLKMNVKKGNGMADANFTDMTAVLKGIPVTADFSLSTAAFSNTGTAPESGFGALKVSAGSGYDACFEAILIPQPTGSANRKVVFTVNGEDFMWSIPDNTTAPFMSGNQHTWDITVSKTGITATPQTITPWTNGGSTGGSTTTGHYLDGYYYTAEAWRFIEWAQRSDDWKNSNFTLTSDIDLTGYDWIPVGEEGARFTRTFNGGGYTIKGLSVNTSATYAGLFGVVGSGGSVQNVTVSGTVEGAGSLTGGIAGWNGGGAIADCSFSGTVTGAVAVAVGGIAGESTGAITGCSFSGTVEGTGNYSYVGGIAGYSSRPITGCSFSGTVEGTGLVGGIAGYNFHSTITGCSVGENSTVTGTGNYSFVGGIAGENYGPITGCSVGENSTVTGTGSSSSVGGIAVRNYGAITGSWSAAKSVTGTGEGGGIAGINEGGGTIQYCYWLWDDTTSTGFDGTAVGLGDAAINCEKFAIVSALNDKVSDMNTAISGWEWIAGTDPATDWPTIQKIL